MAEFNRAKLFGFFTIMAWASLFKPRTGREMVDRAQEGADAHARRRSMDAIRGASSRWGTDQCWCHACRNLRPMTLDDIRMVLCPTCGNKRCPKANDHRNECTGSNEPGQRGSAYP